MQDEKTLMDKLLAVGVPEGFQKEPNWELGAREADPRFNLWEALKGLFE